MLFSYIYSVVIGAVVSNFVVVVSLLVSGIDLVKKKEKQETARSINWSTGRMPLIKPKQAVPVRTMKTKRDVDEIIPFMFVL